MSTSNLHKRICAINIVEAVFNACCAVWLGIVLMASVQAQSFTGSITGTVNDPNGAAIVSATVTLTATDTGQTR